MRPEAREENEDKPKWANFGNGIVSPFGKGYPIEAMTNKIKR